MCPLRASPALTTHVQGTPGRPSLARVCPGAGRGVAQASQGAQFLASVSHLSTLSEVGGGRALCTSPGTPPTTRLLQAPLSRLGWLGGPSLPRGAGELQPGLHGNGLAGCLFSAGAPPHPGLQEVREKDGHLLSPLGSVELQVLSPRLGQAGCLKAPADAVTALVAWGQGY